MKQKTTAQIREELRKEMTKMFDRKYQYLTDELERYKNLYHRELEKRVHRNYEYSELKDENIRLKDKVAQYEDWIERLQDFLNIEDSEEREAAFQTYMKEKKAKAELSDMISVYSNMIGNMFNF